MRFRYSIILFSLALFAAFGASVLRAAPPKDAAKPPTKQAKGEVKKPPFDRVVKSEAEWKKILSPNAFQVTRKAATEPPYQNEYWNNHETGVYRCVDCGLELFSSRTKFESQTGWPSFWQPIDPRYITKHSDHDLGYERTEVRCARCDAHLGHVFDDGPRPTGLRYCMNSAALKFVRESKDAKGSVAAPKQ